MTRITTCLLAAALTAVSVHGADRIEQNEPPSITHYPSVVAYRGQPIPVYARVRDETGKIRKVSLFYALSQQNVPLEVPMKKVRGDRYSGLIPANFFSEASKIWYFIRARDSFDDLGETTWYPVLIKDPERTRTQEEQAAETAEAAQGAEAASAGTAGSAGPPGIVFPQGAVAASSTGGGIGAGTVIGGVLVGGAIAGGAIALSDSGGDDEDGGSGGGGGFDPSSTVIVNATGSASGGFASGPQDQTVNGSGAVGGRPISGIRATVNYQAYNVVDRFQIVYQGNVIADSGNVSGSGTITGTSGGTSPNVVIRVLTPSSGTAWDWSARVEYSVAE